MSWVLDYFDSIRALLWRYELGLMGSVFKASALCACVCYTVKCALSAQNASDDQNALDSHALHACARQCYSTRTSTELGEGSRNEKGDQKK